MSKNKTIKKIYSLITLLLLTAGVFFTQQATAQAPQKMSYQSVIRNSSNVLLVNTAARIKISVLQGSATGTAVYVETQTATTNANGLVSIQIGTGTASTGTFAGINWSAGPYFIRTETDPAGGTNYTITGTQEILSVPYAMYAAKSGDATTMGTIGGSSSTNGGTITGGVLSLTPANATNGGIVTNGTQTIGGAKTFTQSVTANSFVKTGGVSSQYLMADGSTSAVQVNTCDLCLAIAALQAQISTMQTQITSLNQLVLTSNLKVGDIYQGGIIGYIFQSGDPGYVAGETHGLIAAQSDQNSPEGIPWSNGLSGIETGATGFNIGTGRSNTDMIIAIQGPISTNYAAGLARAYNGGGFTDWFLPSLREWEKLVINRSIIGLNGPYWTSTETDIAEFAWYWGLGIAGLNAREKDAQFNVRAVRTF